MVISGDDMFAQRNDCSGERLSQPGQLISWSRNQLECIRTPAGKVEPSHIRLSAGQKTSAILRMFGSIKLAEVKASQPIFRRMTVELIWKWIFGWNESCQDSQSR